MLRSMGGVAAVAVVMILPVSGQWLKIPESNVPKGPDGKPNLSAPAPRRADGKPDLSGVWNPNPKYLVNFAADLKPEEVPLQPWALALYNERKEGKHSKEEPDANCLPQGVPKIDTAPAPYKFLQLPGLVIILYEAFTQYRQVFMDGRELPKDPNPTWLGYSVGKWDGDTLVVESAGYNGKAWLDQQGHPLTDALHVTERFRRKDFGHIDLEVTIDDPKAYTRPWTAKENLTLMVDGELLEFVCQENEKDIRHMVNQ
jgi:hypothetical protein